jgi:hypothetical protein
LFVGRQKLSMIAEKQQEFRWLHDKLGIAMPGNNGHLTAMLASFLSKRRRGKSSEWPLLRRPVVPR